MYGYVFKAERSERRKLRPKKHFTNTFNAGEHSAQFNEADDEENDRYHGSFVENF
jgi:hypothetical protein